MLQEAPGEASPATFLFVVTTAGQASGKATYGILYLVERAATALLLLTFLLAFAAFAIGGTVVVLGLA